MLSALFQKNSYKALSLILLLLIVCSVALYYILEAKPAKASLEASSGSLQPDFVGITKWMHTPPLTLRQLRGKVVLVDFWTYTCSSCIRTLPYLKEWDAKYRKEGLVIVGVHTPEFAFEQNPRHVEQATLRFGLHYPIALDNDAKTWQQFHNTTWPAHYLIDQTGIIRSFHAGEGAYLETENAIRTLLNQSAFTGNKAQPDAFEITPKIYLGEMRATHYTPTNTIQPEAQAFYAYQGNLGEDQVGLRGHWKVTGEKITAMGNSSFIDLNFLASVVHLVMESDRLEQIPLFLDHQPLKKKQATKDSKDGGRIAVQAPRKYDLLSLEGAPSRHHLTLHVPNGVSLYAFTFGQEP